MKETLIINLNQVLKDVEEIRYIKALPEKEEYVSEADREQGLYVIAMSMAAEDKYLQTPMERKLHKIGRIREKIKFRLRAAEEQFI